jgi:adenylate cyclase
VSILKKHVVVGSISAVIIIILSFLPFGELLELKGYDLFHFFIRPPGPPKDIVIVAIDEPSFSEIGLQWPWPRSLHARLIDVLKREGASVIGFDIAFFEPAQADEDTTLAQAMHRAANVCLASEIGEIDRKGYSQKTLIEPIPLLKENSFTGIVNILLDKDAIVRKFYPVEEHEILFAKQVARLFVKQEFEVGENSYVSYVGPPGSFTTVSYYQALEPSLFLPEDFFKNKIVIVGRHLKTSPEPGKTYPDIFATPFLFGRKTDMMSGVELQANMVHDFMTGSFVTRSSRFSSILLFILISISGSFAQIRWKPLFSGLLTFIFFSACLISAYFLFQHYRLWIPTFLMIVPFSLNYGIFGVLTYVETEKNRREIKKAFSHYLSPAVLQTVLDNPGKLKLGGETVDATILFSDIAGFTAMSEKLPPEDVSRFLNRYFDEMTKIVFAHKGTVDKFIGDGLITFWGAPVPDPEHALNACHTAIEMQERMITLRHEMKSQDMPEISIRIGINSGRVIVGNMGSSSLFNYTAIGDAVNLASRLEAANKDTGTSILISRSVYERVAAHADIRPLGTIAVRGKTQEIEVYELLSIDSPGVQT